MSGSLARPDWGTAIADLARRLGVLERRITSRTATAAAPVSSSGRIALSVSQSCPSGLTELSGWSVDETVGSPISVDGFGSAAYNQAGFYIVSAMADTNWGTTSYVFIQIGDEFGHTIEARLPVASSGVQAGLAISFAYYFNADDRVRVSVGHNADAAVTVFANAYVIGPL